MATYRGPGKVVRRLLDMGPREDRALAFLMAGCGVMFISQWPFLARRAHLEELELNGLLAGALMGTLFLAPLLFYALAGVSHLVAKLLGGKGSFYNARVALFWALLAASPLMLLFGLTRGFVGPGPEEQLVGFVWFVLFSWFWLRGLVVAEQDVAEQSP